MRTVSRILVTLTAWCFALGSHRVNAEDYEVAWPISRSSRPDTEFVVFPYGPRNIGTYNFHAGIDIYVERGTPVGSIMAGKVLYTNKSTVLIAHSDERKSAYLHLNSVNVQKGDHVRVGEVVGTVGDVNAKDVHLHLTYLVGPKQFTDEVESRNPLEVLPHKPPRAPTAKFEGDSVKITLDAGVMTVKRITLVCINGKEFVIDYYDIVKLGRKLRHKQIQSEIRLDVSRPRREQDGTRVFDLTLGTADPELSIGRLVLEDINGKVLLDAKPAEAER
jgi:murein DD-endopeptidase MepM/ murein hydrolase activator NlpD